MTGASGATTGPPACDAQPQAPAPPREEPAELPDVAPELLAAVEDAVGTALAAPPEETPPGEAVLAEAVPIPETRAPVEDGVGATIAPEDAPESPEPDRDHHRA